jgi:hypothetical protein
VVGSGMRVGRPAGGSVVAAPDGTTQERLVPRRVVVGNLGYDVSFTRPKSFATNSRFQGGFGPPNRLVSSSRCRSASLSIGYAVAIYKPMAVGGTRVVGSGMRVGRPAGGSVVAAPDGTTQERLVPRRVVVGNLGYDVRSCGRFGRPPSRRRRSRRRRG